jgi:hypothetical protein
MQRELKVAGSYDEKRHAGSYERVKERRPESIGLIQNQRSVSTKIERLSAVDQDYHKTGSNPHPVYPYFTRFHIHQAMYNLAR